MAQSFVGLTADLFASIIFQVHAALERGLVKIDDVQAAVNVDAIGRQCTPDSTTLNDRFKPLVATLVRKVYQDSLDGIGR